MRPPARPRFAPARTRRNCCVNIASGAHMPASLLNALCGGLGYDMSRPREPAPFDVTPCASYLIFPLPVIGHSATRRSPSIT